MTARFTFHPFGAEAAEAFAACDGLVDGAGLHLSHWAGNRTPREWKRDTSVEIALAYAAARPEEARERPVANNHFDADGVIAVWVLLEPERAAEHTELIVAAAEAGDFDEWPALDSGLRLEAAVRALARGAGSDEAAYARVLPELGALVADVEAREDLWGEPWRALSRAEEAAGDGALAVARAGRIALFHHRPGIAELPGPTLTRRAPEGTDRWLLAFERDDGAFDYRYERPRFAWADTVRRPTLATPSRAALAQALPEPAAWARKGELGMTGLLRTTRPIAVTPERIADALVGADRAA